MRDINRIKRILNKLGKFWLLNPDLRLGQIIVNINGRLGYGNDAFFIEDDIVENYLDILIGEK